MTTTQKYKYTAYINIYDTNSHLVAIKSVNLKAKNQGDANRTANRLFRDLIDISPKVEIICNLVGV